MNKPNRTGISRIVWAGYYSAKGLQSAWRNEAAFRQEALAMMLLLPLSYWVGQSIEQKLLLALTCFLVILIELVNSAIEATVDRISIEQHPLAGRAKDMGSAAVLCSIVMLVITWGTIIWSNLPQLIS